jgi:hypothetical protein
MSTPAEFSQPVRALQLANRVRRARSDLKTRIAEGELSAAEVILACPSEVASMRVAQLLACQRGWGEVRTRAFLNRVPLPQGKLIGSLTEGQRHAVASLLTPEIACTHSDRAASALGSSTLRSPRSQK